MSQSLVFQSTQFDVIDRNGQPWLQARHLAQALGYKDESSVRRIYERNADEFTDAMTATVKMTVGITPVEVRIFSLRGCHLLAMFARTSVAKAFRVWVLDVLETLNQPRQKEILLPLPPAPSTAQDRAPLRSLVHAWSTVSGLPHAALWAQVKAHFQLSRIDDLPADWVPDALAFVQGKIDAVSVQKALPSAQGALEAMMIAYVKLKESDGFLTDKGVEA